MAQADFLGDHIQPDAANPRGGPAKVLVNKGLIQTDGLKDLRAAIRLHGGDPHLGHGLDQALVDRLDKVLHGCFVRHLRQMALADQVRERFEGEIGVHATDPVTEQYREVMDFPGFARFQHDADPGAGALADQMMMYAGHGQERRQRRPLVIDGAIRQDQIDDTVCHGLVRRGADALQRGIQPPAARRDRIGDRDHGRAKPRQLCCAEPREFFVGNERGFQLELAAVARPRL